MIVAVIQMSFRQEGVPHDEPDREPCRDRLLDAQIIPFIASKQGSCPWIVVGVDRLREEGTNGFSLWDEGTAEKSPI